MDTQLHPVSAHAKNQRKSTITNYENYEEISIKKEPLEETSQDCELYGSVLQSVKKEECVTDNDEQSDKEYENPITVNNNIGKTENVNSNSFCCDVCNQSFLEKSALEDHEKLHKEKSVFECKTCKKIYPKDSPLDCHIKGHAKKKYLCSTCNKSFTRSSDLKNHMTIHSGVKNYKCTICSKQFTQSRSLKFHLKIHSARGRAVKYFTCPLCCQYFKHRLILERHMEIHNRVKNYDNKCAICGRQFQQSSNLLIHMKIHTNNYQCTVCLMSYTTLNRLKKHMDTHARFNKNLT